MTVTAKLFQFGNSQAVRIPARFRFEGVQEVEVIQRGDELVLRPAVKDAAELFARIRARGADWSDIVRPAQGDMDAIEPLDR